MNSINNNNNPNNRRRNPNSGGNISRNQQNRHNRDVRTNRSSRNSYDGYIKIKNPQTPQRQAKSRGRRKKPPYIKYGFRFLMFLFFFAVIGASCLGIFYLNLTKLKAPAEVLYTVNTIQIKNNKETTVSSPVSLPYDIGFANERYYFPINNIMEKMEFVLVGDKNEFSYVRSKSNEYVKFITDSNIAYINDEKYYLPGPAFMDGENNIYVPLEFLENHFENLQISSDEKKRGKITVDVGDIENSCFKIQKAKKLEAAKESDAPYFTAEPVSVISDLSGYEQYFNPPNESPDEYIVLINQANPLEPQDYVPPDLVDTEDTREGRDVQKLRLYPAMAVKAFLIEARANGFTNISITSGYRSYGLQIYLFNQEVERLRPTQGDNAEALAATSVAYPGQSEHQSGLAVDMHSYTTADQDFGDTPGGRWLAENAHHFGFILRYPKDKTEITGIKYEPWHFRYVGRFHATKIYESGLCLEEYWERYLEK